MAEPVRLLALAGTAVILTIVGPFGTGEVMGALPRLAYWALIVGLSYSAGYAANALATGSLARRIAVAGALTSLGALAVVMLANGLAFGYWPTGWALVRLAANIAAIAVIVTAIFQVAAGSRDPAAPGPDLQDRLPMERRGALVSLSVEDHYVRIRTTRGEGLVLMRLSDAIREAHATPGLQVHRSHWVALDQVRAAARRGDGAVLTMATGPEIPVSRANVAAIRAAGLLPK